MLSGYLRWKSWRICWRETEMQSFWIHNIIIKQLCMELPMILLQHQQIGDIPKGFQLLTEIEMCSIYRGIQSFFPCNHTFFLWWLLNKHELSSILPIKWWKNDIFTLLHAALYVGKESIPLTSLYRHQTQHQQVVCVMDITLCQCCSFVLFTTRHFVSSSLQSIWFPLHNSHFSSDFV